MAPSFLSKTKDAGIPITYGVGANKICSELGMRQGNKGMTGNIYSRGYSIDTSASTDIVRAL